MIIENREKFHTVVKGICSQKNPTLHNLHHAVYRCAIYTLILPETLK